MKKSILFMVLFFIALSTMAQREARERWGGGVDYEQIHFGFSFHYVGSSFKTFKNENWKDPYSDSNFPDSLMAISSPSKGGVGLGLLADLRLGENSSLRFSPTILFADKKLDFEYGSESISKTVKASLLELPLTFKFKSDRRENYRVYLLGGGKYSLNVVPKSRIDDSNAPTALDKNIKLKPQFFSYEFGLGVDIYFEYFKMSPEIKWAQSVGNVLDKKDLNGFNTPIDRLLLRSIQFSLIFE